MKKYLKENIKNLPFIFVAFIMFYSITTLATNYLFNSNEVSYDNSETGLHADEVQGAIDEVFQHATDYSELKTKIGTNALTTTSQTLTGGVNELKTSVTSLNDQMGSLIVSESVGVPGNGTDHNSVDITKAGYTPLVAVPTAGYGDTAAYTSIWGCYVDGNLLRVYWVGAKSSSVGVSVKVLYVKN